MLYAIHQMGKAHLLFTPISTLATLVLQCLVPNIARWHCTLTCWTLCCHNTDICIITMHAQIASGTMHTRLLVRAWCSCSCSVNARVLCVYIRLPAAQFCQRSTVHIRIHTQLIQRSTLTCVMCVCGIITQISYSGTLCKHTMELYVNAFVAHFAECSLSSSELVRFWSSEYN